MLSGPARHVNERRTIEEDHMKRGVEVDSNITALMKVER